MVEARQAGEAPADPTPAPHPPENYSYPPSRDGAQNQKSPSKQIPKHLPPELMAEAEKKDSKGRRMGLRGKAVRKVKKELGIADGLDGLPTTAGNLKKQQARAQEYGGWRKLEEWIRQKSQFTLWPCDVEHMHRGGRGLVPIDVIAARMGVSEVELYRRMSLERDPEQELRRAYEAGKAEIEVELRESQLHAAIEKGSDTMMIWTGKQVLGQADRSFIETTHHGKLDEIPDEELAVLGAKALRALGKAHLIDKVIPGLVQKVESVPVEKNPGEAVTVPALPQAVGEKPREEAG